MKHKIIMHGLPGSEDSWVREKFIGNMGRTDYDDSLAQQTEWPVSCNDMAAIERRILQRTYGRAGAWFLQSWFCPESLLLCACYGSATANGAGFWATVKAWRTARKASRK